MVMGWSGAMVLLSAYVGVDLCTYNHQPGRCVLVCTHGRA